MKPILTAQLYEPDPLLAAALQQALNGRVDLKLEAAAPQIAGQGLLILGGPNAVQASKAYAAMANILVLDDGKGGECSYPTLVKPFRFGAFVELATRLARRLPQLKLGTSILRPQSRQLEQENGTSIALTEKEVDILLYLATLDAPVARDVLLEEVWGYNQGVTTHTLETHIYRLRQKIEADPESPTLLKNGPLPDNSGNGYYLDMA